MSGVTDVALLKIGTESPSATSHEEAWERFTKAVTDWLNEAVEGKEAWELSSADFNIADFVTDVDLSDIEFTERCDKHGVVVLEAAVLDMDMHVPFDRILNNHPDENEETDSDSE